MHASGKSGYLQQRVEKQNHLQILVKSIHAEVCGSASSLLLLKTASGLSTLCRQTLYHIAFYAALVALHCLAVLPAPL